MQIYNKSLIAIAFILFSGNALAHEDWIEPSNFSFSQSEKKRLPYTLNFDITASDNYFNADRNRLLEDVGGFSFLAISPDNTPVVPDALTLAKTKTTGEVTLRQHGTYVLSLTRNSEPMYYSELKLPDNSGVEYVVRPKDRLTTDQLERWNETGAYFHNAKAYVQVEQPTDSWKTPLGHNKEIVPLSNPNAIKQGMPFKVQVLFNGETMPDAEIRMIYQDYQATAYGSSPFQVKTDADGNASLTFDRPGRWLLESHHNVKHTDTSKAGKTKYAAALMVEVSE